MNILEPHFLIVAGEASGDLHGAKLVQSLLGYLSQGSVYWNGGDPYA